MNKTKLLAKDKLKKEIIITLIIKILFLYCLWFLFFQDPGKPLPVKQQFENHVFGQLAPNDSNSTVDLLADKKEP